MREKRLYYFRCRLCTSVLAQSVKTVDWERCNGCRGFAKFTHDVVADTPELLAIHARGKMWNPHPPEPPTWVCAKCGKTFVTFQVRYREAARWCVACARADEQSQPILTPAEQHARQREREAFRQQIEDDFEQAHKAAEAGQ